MILLCGIPSEPPLARVAHELDRLGVPTTVFNQREAVAGRCTFELDGSGLRGELQLSRGTLRLEDVAAVYTRLMDDRILPELDSEPPDSPARTACRELHDTLYRWMEITPARVVNRASAMASNGSKPYQAQLIAPCGLRDPRDARDQRPRARARVLRAARPRRLQVGQRVALDRAGAHLDDLDRIDDIRWCPVQFQAYVEGVDVRVHVVGRADLRDARDLGSDGLPLRGPRRRTAGPARGDDARRRDGRAVHRPHRVSSGCASAGSTCADPRGRSRLLRGQPVSGLRLLRGPHRSADRRRGGTAPRRRRALSAERLPET